MNTNLIVCSCGKVYQRHLDAVSCAAAAHNYDPLIFTLADVLTTQHQLQLAMGQPLGVGEAGVKEALLALVVEAVEALNEVNWKPWKQTLKEVNRLKLLTELTDILQFWANSISAMGFEPEDVAAALRRKWNVNVARINEGY